MWLPSRLCTRVSIPLARQSSRPPARARCRPRLESLEDRWVPSQIGLTVNSLADSGPGSLRAAILAADAGSPTDKFTIGFAVSGTIDLQSPLPDLNNSIAIQGPGENNLTLERAAGDSFASAIVTVDPAQVASLSGVSIAHGNAGGVTNYGTLTVSNCALTGNSAEKGGGIENVTLNGIANLTVIGTTFSGNSAARSGGGIDNSDAVLTISGCDFRGNSAQDAGGAIESFGSATVSTSTFADNSAFLFGGGIAAAGSMTIRNSGFDLNSAAQGGGIGNSGTLTVAGCGFTRNSAQSVTLANGVVFGGEGGAILNAGELEVRGSSFTVNNTASDFGGAIWNGAIATLQECILSGNSAGSAGGGIFNAASGTLTIDDSSVINNVAPLGADLANLGTLTVNDSTVG